jgi:hypothetical protein
LTSRGSASGSPSSSRSPRIRSCGTTASARSSSCARSAAPSARWRATTR